MCFNCCSLNHSNYIANVHNNYVLILVCKKKKKSNTILCIIKDKSGQVDEHELVLHSGN